MGIISKRLLFSCLAFGITACLCLSLLSIAAVTVLLTTSNESASLLPTATMLSPSHTPYPLIPTSTPAAEVLPTSEVAHPTSTTVLPEELSIQMDEIESQVSELRGLHTGNQVPRNLLTQDQLQQQVLTDFMKDYTAEEARDDAIELAAFGLLESDFDLYKLYVDLFTEQIAGYYDHEKDSMYIVQGSGFNGFERETYSHEYTHALQDQTYDIEKGLNWNDEACDLDTERCAAIQALLEGDARLTESQWLNTYA